MTALMEKVRKAVERIPRVSRDMYQRGQDMRDGDLLANEIDALLAAALAEVEEWEALVARGDTYRAMLSQTTARAEAAEAEADRLKAALTALVERVEMDESVGVCLTSRVESLNALAALAPADRNTT